MSLRRYRSTAALLAILAIALQALWPLLAQAKPKSVLLVPVCTVQGVTHYVELPKSGVPVEQKAASQHDHCSFCGSGAERVALPASTPVIPAVDRAFGLPRSSESSSLQSQKHLRARSRAPPILV